MKEHVDSMPNQSIIVKINMFVASFFQSALSLSYEMLYRNMELLRNKTT